MINKSKRAARFVFIVIACIVFLNACSDKEPKTIVMEDSVQSDSSAETQNPENGKVYQYNSFNIIDNEPVDEQLFGWVDGNNAADLVYKEKSDETTIQSVNYKYHFTKEIMPVTEDIATYSLSPDGRSLAYVRKNDTLQYVVRDISTGRDTQLFEWNRDFSISGVGIGWSGNSSYLTYSIYDYKAGTCIVTVFDLIHGESRQFTLELDPASNGIIESDVLSAAVSDDGARLLITSDNLLGYENTKSLVFIYDIKANEFIPAKRFYDFKKAYPDFFSANQVMFVDTSSYALCLYDIDREETAVIGNNIIYYKLSDDGKNIAYVKLSENKEFNIYTAALEGETLGNETRIYQGILPTDIWWSPDKSKILMRGSFMHIYHTAGPAPQLENSASETIIIELQ